MRWTIEERVCERSWLLDVKVGREPSGSSKLEDWGEDRRPEGVACGGKGDAGTAIVQCSCVGGRVQQPVRQTKIPVLDGLSGLWKRQTGKCKGFSSKQEPVGVSGSFPLGEMNTCLLTLHRAPTTDQRLLPPKSESCLWRQ